MPLMMVQVILLLSNLMSETKSSFCLLFLAVLTFSACADEQEMGRKWCRKAAQVAGSLCLEGNSGAEGNVRIRVFGTTNVSQVNLSELGGSSRRIAGRHTELSKPRNWKSFLELRQRHPLS